MSSTSSNRLFARPAVMAITAVCCCLLWGSAFSCIKIGYHLFGVAAGDTAGQILFAGCRFTLAGVLVIAAGSALQRRFLRPRRAAARPIALLALTQTAVQYLLFYIGLAHTSGVNSSIINGAGTAVTILTACFVFRCERMTARKAVGCLLGFGGVLLLNLSGGQWAFRPDGEGFILLSTVASACATILIKRFSQKEDPVLLSGWQFFFGGLALTAGGLIFGGGLHPQSAAAWGLLFYLGFLSAAAYTLWGVLLSFHPVSAVSAYKCLVPLCGTLLSAWLLGESGALLRWEAPAALALVIAGVWVLNRKKA